MLLCSEACALADVGHHPWSLLLSVLPAVPHIDWGEAVVRWLVRGLRPRKCEGLLDADHVASAVERELEGCNTETGGTT
jgi:hypothetical protein